VSRVRLVIARCSVDYVGRLTAHLPMASRLILIKADGSVSIHADDRAFKPLNWMNPPCSLREEPHTENGAIAKWTVTHGKSGEQLILTIEEIQHDSSHELGLDPGLQKDGVEAHLQELLAEHITTLGDGFTLIRREYPTAIGPVDILCREAAAALEIEHNGDSRSTTHAVEIKRHATIDAVEQLTRYLELLNRDPLLAPVKGILAAQTIKPQARVLAEDRGIRCVVLDYDQLRGIEQEGVLF
jgi:endonuclease